MPTGDVGQLSQDAVEKIIFHATPKKWLRERGPWLLGRGQGVFLYDSEGREYQVTARTMQTGMFGPRPIGGSTLVFAPPLIFTRAQAEWSVDLLDSALSKVEAGILPMAVAR